jgi:hypothetical protein
MTFLSVITRCYKRPTLLARNVASLEAQTDQDYERVLTEDIEGRGIGWANRVLSTVEPAGVYVMVLDDDDMLIDNQAIEKMKIATVDRPALVIFKADHQELGILPSGSVWNNRPIGGQIGSISFISRRDIWERHIHAFGVNSGGDYNYLRNVWQTKPSVVWLDEVLAGVQRISRGKPE